MAIGKEKGVIGLGCRGRELRLFLIIDAFQESAMIDDILGHPLAPLAAQFDVAENIVQAIGRILESRGRLRGVLEFILNVAILLRTVLFKFPKEFLILL